MGGFLDRLQALPHVEIVHVDEATEVEAWRWPRARGEREHSIREALPFDGHFNAAGFVEVRAS